MKTLKKTLCLVLAVVMVVGALVLPASAAYKDNTSIDDDYKKAVNDLTTWKIMEGDANGNFKPKASIQRQEMAAIVYRLLTGDNGGYGDDKSAIYTPYAAKFTDVDTKGWAAGYIGYCANKGIIVGTNPAQTTFEPTRAIPANDVLAMLLRAVGYGQNGEYTGPGWTTNVGSDAARVGLTKGITSKLDAISERQEVAQMTYQAATTNRVTWSEAEQKYIPYVTPNNPGSGKNIPLVKTEKVDATNPSYDIWGAPTGGTAATTNVIFTYPSPAATYKVPVANPYPMLWQTWDAVTECDVADALDIDGNHWAITYTNGIGNVNLGNGNSKLTTKAMPFEATDTVNKIGHEGRHTMVYKNPKFSGTPSETNPDYIFVFVDEFLAKVTSTWDAVVDHNEHVIKAAGANVTVYSNATATTSGGTPLQTTLTGTGYKVGQVLGVHLETKTDLNTLAGSTIVTEAKAAGYGPFALNTASVTISGIIRDNDSTGTPVAGPTAQRIVGFVTSTGARYFYDYTFSGTLIDEEDIGKTAVLTLDSQGNVLDYTFVTNAPGFGVTLNAMTKQVSINEWVVTYTILLPDGSQTTIDVGQATSGAPFTTEADAITQGTTTVGKNVLVNYELGTGGKYYVFNQQSNLIGTTSGISLQDNTIVSGRPAALSKGYTQAGDDPVRGDSTAITAGTLVDDNTVFFVAQYDPNNVTSTANDYTMTGYKIYTGFKNIPDLTSVSGAVSDASGNASLANLMVTAFDVDDEGKVAAAADGQVAKYVLVLNAVKQSTPKTINTVNYAYLITNDLFVEVGATTFTYPAIINGQSGQNLQVKLASNNPLSKSGLYTYANWTNGEGYSDVYMLDTTNQPVNTSLAAPYNGNFKIEAGKYVYANGVLTALNTKISSKGAAPTYAGTDVPYAVAAGCPVYLVNPVTGGVTTNTLSLLNVDTYTFNCDIWFQLDANGYISLIYMIDNQNTAVDNPGQSAAKTLTLTPTASDTATASAGGATLTLGTGIVTAGTATGQLTITAKVKAWATGVGFVDYGTATGTAVSVGTNITVFTCTPVLSPDTTYVFEVTAKAADGTSQTTSFSFRTGSTIS